MMKATHPPSAYNLISSACDLMASMLDVKKFALLLVFEDGSVSQYESSISEYQSFDMSVVTRLWFSRTSADLSTFSLNPRLDTSNSILVNELRLVAPWVKCLKVISLETDCDSDEKLPLILICLLDTRASKLNRNLTDDWFFARQLIKNIVTESISRVEQRYAER